MLPDYSSKELSILCAVAILGCHSQLFPLYTFPKTSDINVVLLYPVLYFLLSRRNFWELKCPVKIPLTREVLLKCFFSCLQIMGNFRLISLETCLSQRAFMVWVSLLFFVLFDTFVQPTSSSSCGRACQYQQARERLVQDEEKLGFDYGVPLNQEERSGILH